MCPCGNAIDHNGRKGLCSPCYRKEWRKTQDKAKRNAYLRKRRAEGKIKLSDATKQRRAEMQRIRRAADPAGRRVEKYQRRTTLGKIDKEYIEILIGAPCVYCGEPSDTVDHIVALSKGGTNDWFNMSSACRSCNSGKFNHDVLQYMLRRIA